MLDPELLRKTLKQTLSRGGDFADVFVERRTPTYLFLEDNRLEQAVTGTEGGAGVRLLLREKTFMALTSDLSEPNLLECASLLSRAASGQSTENTFELTPRTPLHDFPITEPPESVSTERKVELVRAANLAARGFGRHIRQVSVTYRDVIQKVQIAASSGELCEEERIHTLGIVQVVAEGDGTVQTGVEQIGGLTGFELFREEALERAACNAAGRAVRMLRARRAPGGRMPVVISSEAGGTMIHEAIGHGLEADLAGQGLSRFSGKLGHHVASPLVSVIDDATLQGKRGSYRFDDEGTSAQRTVLVEGGVLRSYLYDRLSAMREGVASTGNGRRESYRHRPIPRMTNTFISPGASRPEEIIRSTKRGLFVKKMGGGQVNTVSGDFVFDVMEGYLIEGGSVGEAVRGATLTGSGPEVLLSIDMVAGDLGFSIGTCGKDSQGVPVSDAMPTVRIPEMVVGGEV
jgi:TldD protein